MVAGPPVRPGPVAPGWPGGQAEQHEQDDQHRDERERLPGGERDPEPDDQDGQHRAEPAACGPGGDRQRLVLSRPDLGIGVGNRRLGLLGQVTGQVTEPAPGPRGERKSSPLVELLQGQPACAVRVTQDLDNVFPVGVRRADTAVIRHLRTSPRRCHPSYAPFIRRIPRTGRDGPRPGHRKAGGGPGPARSAGRDRDLPRGPHVVKSAPLWLDLAVPPVPRRLTQDRNHLIVCGDDVLAYRVVEELTVNYGERVTVLLSARTRGHGPRIARLAGVRVIERPELDGTAFADAGARSARAIALMGRDDLSNFHAALRAQDVSPGLRLVMRIFNTGLGERMRGFFPDCAVLSSSSMAAPSFVAAALGEPAPSHVRLAGRTLFVARPGEADAAHLVCGLATTGAPGQPQLLPPDQGLADLVLAVADGTPRNPLTRQRRRPLRAVVDLPRLLFGYKLGLVFLALFGVLVAGFVLLATTGGYSPGNALYLTFLDAASRALSKSE